MSATTGPGIQAAPATAVATEAADDQPRPALAEFSSNELVERDAPVVNGVEAEPVNGAVDGSGEPADDIVMPPPPDDPGPEPEVDPDARPRRFRLFS